MSLKKYSEVVLYDRNIIDSSSEIFGYRRQSSAIFRKCSENVRRRSRRLRNNFGKSSELFGKWSEIFGKSSKTSLLVCLYNKQNNTWTLGDMEFIFSCSRSISMRTLEDKFHISARPCIILYFFRLQPSPPHLASTRNQNFSMGRTGFFLEIDF